MTRLDIMNDSTGFSVYRHNVAWTLTRFVPFGVYSAWHSFAARLPLLSLNVPSGNTVMYLPAYAVQFWFEPRRWSGRLLHTAWFLPPHFRDGPDSRDKRFARLAFTYFLPHFTATLLVCLAQPHAVPAFFRLSAFADTAHIPFAHDIHQRHHLLILLATSFFSAGVIAGVTAVSPVTVVTVLSARRTTVTCNALCSGDSRY